MKPSSIDRHKKIHKSRPHVQTTTHKSESQVDDYDLLNNLYNIDSAMVPTDNDADRKFKRKPDPLISEKTLNNIKYTVIKDDNRERKFAQNTTGNPVMIEVIANDRHGRKERIKCYPSDTILVLKKLIAAKLGTRWEKLKLQRANAALSDQITLEDYEIKNGSSLEIYYN